MSEAEKILEYRMNSLEAAVGEIKLAVKSIDTSMQVIARLETKHLESQETMKRMWEVLESHAARLDVLEKEWPMTRFVRDWTLRGAVAIVAIVCLAIVGLVVVSK